MGFWSCKGSKVKFKGPKSHSPASYQQSQQNKLIVNNETTKITIGNISTGIRSWKVDNQLFGFIR